jgi:hypothetical protein
MGLEQKRLGDARAGVVMSRVCKPNVVKVGVCFIGSGNTRPNHCDD